MAKVLMIIAPERFRDEELFVTREELEKDGHEIVIASSVKGQCPGSRGGFARATFATNFARISNGNLFQLQALLGHATLDMSRKYVQLAAADEAQLTNTRESQVDKLIQPVQQPVNVIVPEQSSLQAQIALLNLKLLKMTLEMDIMQKEYSYQPR